MKIENYPEEKEEKIVTNIMYKRINLYRYEHNNDNFVLINGKKISIKEFRENH